MERKIIEFIFLPQLYGEFADHYKLSECKLAIIHCAGHSDQILVHSLWQEILEKGELKSRPCGIFHCCLYSTHVPYSLDVLSSRTERQRGHESSRQDEVPQSETGYTGEDLRWNT